MLRTVHNFSPEQEFISELNSYLEYPLGKHGENKVKQMLLEYRTKNPFLKIIHQTDPKLVAQILDRPKNPKKIIKPEDIIRIVSEYVNIAADKFVHVKCRAIELVYARYLCMFFCRRYSKLSFKQIGQRIGGKDHTTVIYGCISLKELIETDEKVKDDVENINAKIVEFRTKLNNN
jgi:hypothetical protein